MDVYIYRGIERGRLTLLTLLIATLTLVKVADMLGLGASG